MGIVSKLVSVVAKAKFRQLEKVIESPIESMNNKLFSILEAQKETAYGRKYGFETIRSPEDYAERVPLVDFEDMKSYYERVYANPTGQILTRDPVLWYVSSSGTSGDPKVLPLTKSGMADVSKGTTANQFAFLQAEPENAKIFDGKIVMFGASANLDSKAGIPVGYMSGVIASLGTNFLVKRTIIPGLDLYNISDMDDKMREYAKLTIENDVRGFAGITTLSLAFFRRMQTDYGPWLLDIYRGTKHEEKLRNAMNDDCTLSLERLWPNLKQFVATGIDTDPYRSWIKKTLPNTTIWEAYVGSEGWYANQVYSDKGLLIMPHLNYLEFIPEEESEDKHPTTIPMSEVKKGKRYEIVLTNMGGYYRYRIGDLMTFVSTDPYEIRSIGRKGKYVNLSGEKLTDAHVQRAITHACKRTSAEVVEFTVVGQVTGGVPYYTIAAMFRNLEFDPVEFVGSFEESLRTHSEEFRVVRDMGALEATKLMRMRTSAFEDRVRAHHIQTKPVPLTRDNRILEGCEVLA